MFRIWWSFHYLNPAGAILVSHSTITFIFVVPHSAQIRDCQLLEKPNWKWVNPSQMFEPMAIAIRARGTRSQSGEKDLCCMLMLTFLEQRALFSFYTCLITRELSSYTNFSHLSAKSVLQMHNAALRNIM